LQYDEEEGKKSRHTSPHEEVIMGGELNWSASWLGDGKRNVVPRRKAPTPYSPPEGRTKSIGIGYRKKRPRNYSLAQKNRTTIGDGGLGEGS